MLSMEEPAEEVNMADPFKDVIASVDTMLEDLKKEEADDLAKKEHCEKERSEKTQEAKMTSAAYLRIFEICRTGWIV